MPAFRQTSSTVVPSSACFNMNAICCSLNLLFLQVIKDIFARLFLKCLHHWHMPGRIKPLSIIERRTDHHLRWAWTCKARSERKLKRSRKRYSAYCHSFIISDCCGTQSAKDNTI